MSQRFEVPGKLPGLNEYTSACRGNRYGGGKMKREAQARVCEAIKAAGLSPMKPHIDIHITWVEPNARRDKDNVAFAKKFILDALVECGVIGDDGWAWVDNLGDSFFVNAGNPRVIVELQGKEQE